MNGITTTRNRSWSDETNIISIEPALMQGILPN